MTKRTSIKGTAEAWDTRQLGNDAAHAKQAPAELQQEIDDALGLQAISIRLPRSTIQTYKHLAELHGVGYQPLMRDAIMRWADGELKQLLAGAVESQRTRAKQAPQGKAKQALEAEEAPPPSMKKVA